MESLGGVDLNLLVVLHALLHTRSVTAAGQRLGLSQSATSHALARLRRALADPLFVRTAGGLVPTARASALAEPLADALARLQHVVAPPRAFDPSAARRKFSVTTSDYAQFMLLPDLVARVAAAAPGVDLRVDPIQADGSEALEHGRTDVALTVSPHETTRAGIKTRHLFDESFVCLVRRGHPAVRRRWSAASFAALQHALVAPGGNAHGIVDDALALQGLSRRVTLMIPHFLVAPFVIAASDLVLTMPDRVAREFARHLPLEVVEPPLTLPGFSFSLLWHERDHHDPAHAWLRKQIIATTEAVFGGRRRKSR